MRSVFMGEIWHQHNIINQSFADIADTEFHHSVSQSVVKSIIYQLFTDDVNFLSINKSVSQSVVKSIIYQLFTDDDVNFLSINKSIN